MKAILVIDEMPTGCIDCPCYCEDRNKCQNTWERVEDDYARPSWCYLKPLPEKDAVTEDDEFVYKDDLRMASYLIGYSKGRNEVINEITGETK